jgi:putative PIN family toxin of toxin-antitoxin system
MPIESKKPRVVIDTNVFVSGLNFAGKPGEVLELFIRGDIEVIISPFILSEIERILRERFDWIKGNIHRVLNRIKRQTILVHPKLKVTIIKRKDDDNRILECAIEGKVQYLISGDRKHLLPLKEYKGIKILSPAEFLKLLFL